MNGGIKMNAKGTVFRYGDNVDTDVIIPARYLNTPNGKELAMHCMEDIDANFVKEVKQGDVIVADKNFGCGSRMNWHTSRREKRKNTAQNGKRRLTQFLKNITK